MPKNTVSRILEMLLLCFRLVLKTHIHVIFLSRSYFRRVYEDLWQVQLLERQVRLAEASCQNRSLKCIASSD